MQKFSRRQLANYAVSQLQAGKSSADIAASLAASLVSSKRTNQVDQLMADVAYEMEHRGLAAQVVATTAYSLDASIAKEIENLVAKTTGVDKVYLEQIVDESVIGGVRIETATKSWDETLKKRLSDIREAF